jgi:cytolysin (calcineurin-like family phosphatase)
MARIAGKDLDLSYNSVAIEDELNQVDLNIDVDVIEVTAFADGAKTYVEGKYGWNVSVQGAWDPAASQGDATIFGQIGSGAAPIIDTPGGGTESSSNPDYTGSAFVRRYQVSAGVATAVTYSAEFQGSAALTRDVTP